MQISLHQKLHNKAQQKRHVCARQQKLVSSPLSVGELGLCKL